MKEKKNSKIILKVFAIIFVIIVIGFIIFGICIAVKHNIDYKEYCQRKYKIGQGTVSNDSSEYLEKVDMDYVEQDGIKIKVDSILITDDCFQADIKLLFNEDIEFTNEKFHLSYAVYDDEKNIYTWSPSLYRLLTYSEERIKYVRNFYKDVGVMYNPWGDSAEIGAGGYIFDSETLQIEINSIRENLPRSKKIYIRIFDLGYAENSSEEVEEFIENFVQVSDAEWIFEIDVPEKFYNRKTICLKPSEEISGIEFSKLELTETALVVAGKYTEITELWREGLEVNGTEYKEWSQKRDNFVYITDGDGTRYDSVLGGSGSGKNSFCFRYLVNKQDLDKKLYLNYTINGVLTTVELVQK